MRRQQTSAGDQPPAREFTDDWLLSEESAKAILSRRSGSPVPPTVESPVPPTVEPTESTEDVLGDNADEAVGEEDLEEDRELTPEEQVEELTMMLQQGRIGPAGEDLALWSTPPIDHPTPIDVSCVVSQCLPRSMGRPGPKCEKTGETGPSHPGTVLCGR